MITKKQVNELSRKLVAEPDNYMDSFRKNMLTFIEPKEISIADIAEGAGLSPDTVKTLVYGKASDCKLSTAVALAKAIGISVDELVGCGTISPTMCESIQITRSLPDNFVHFVRWAIRYHERMLKQKKASKKAINIMYAECSRNGNLTMNNNFELMDISELDDFMRYKIFMGIRIPCEHYMPVLSEGSVLLLADDRKPLQNEMVVVVHNGFIQIVRQREEKIDGKTTVTYHSIRNEKILFGDEAIEEVIGYVVKIV